MLEAEVENEDDDRAAGIPDGVLQSRWDNDRLILGSAGGETIATIRATKDGLYPFLSRHDWTEMRPAWPQRVTSGRQLVRILSSDSPSWIVLIDAIERLVPTPVVIEALNLGSSTVREVLLRVLASRPSPDVATALASCLRDPNQRVRAESAHAFEHRGAGSFGWKLVEAATAESDPDVLELQLRAIATADPNDVPGIREAIKSMSANRELNPRIDRAFRSCLYELGTPGVSDPGPLPPGSIIGPKPHR
jgi:hypothetical protein